MHKLVSIIHGVHPNLRKRVWAAIIEQYYIITYLSLEETFLSKSLLVLHLNFTNKIQT